jgi:hypothetical protein
MDPLTEIELNCPVCGHKGLTAREGDEPADAVLVVATCDDCDEEHDPRYFDMLGGEIET